MIGGEGGGSLGDQTYDIVKGRRTRAVMEAAFKELAELPAGSAAANERSKELGVNRRDPSDLPSPVYDLVSAGGVSTRVPPEILHADALVRTSPMFFTFYFSYSLNSAPTPVF